MILFHGTTAERAKRIFKEGCVNKDSGKFYTRQENGDGYTTDGFIYLSTELTLAIYFANCHTLVDKSTSIFIFKFDIPLNLIEPDFDELRHQGATRILTDYYGGELECSLQEHKCCRVALNICFGSFQSSYIEIELPKSRINEIVGSVGLNLSDTLRSYSDYQKEWMQKISWNQL